MHTRKTRVEMPMAVGRGRPGGRTLAPACWPCDSGQASSAFWADDFGGLSEPI